MAWTTPRTWVDGETPTATIFNAHLTDNISVLKTPIDDLGRIRGLTSSYVADLTGTNLTGLAKLAASNTFTAGRHYFAIAGGLKVPVGTDKWADDGGLKKPGSVWVEGDYLHHVDATRQEWRYLGTVIDGAAGAQPGFLFVVGNGLRYTDSSGKIRECVSSVAHHTDTPALGGSLWVDTYTYWARESGGQTYQGHSDVAHSDHSDHSDHTDHSDHSDHGDVTHVDGPTHSDHSDHVDHGDGPGHADNLSHGDIAHGDTAHTDTDSHNDSSPPHGDGTEHGDVTADSRPVTVA